MKRRLLIAAALLSAGCRQDVDATYGRLSGSSVNGVRVFANLLRSKGCRVESTRRLSPKLRDQTDLIVYFPDIS